MLHFCYFATFWGGKKGCFIWENTRNGGPKSGQNTNFATFSVLHDKKRGGGVRQKSCRGGGCLGGVSVIPWGGYSVYM